MGAYDGQKTSTDVGRPPIPKAPPGYPSTEAAKRAGKSPAVPEGGSPTKGEQRTYYPSGT
ncbi:MAG: hypothetical protein ACXVYY_01465 [Oryzihumus sp.]